MTDETKNPRRPDSDPDLETVDDLGGIDVPDAPETDVPVTPRPARDIYDVTGRARPQKIAPKAPEPEPEPEPDPEPEADDTETTVFASSTEESAGATEVIGDPVGPDSSDTLDDEDAATRVFDPVAVPVDAPAGDDAYASGYGPDYETAVFDDSRPVGEDGAAVAGADGTDVAAAVAEDVEQGAGAVAVASTPRGTLDLGLLILRIVVGVLLILRGAQTLFGFGGDPGVDALESRLFDFIAADILAIALPVVQLVGGGLLLLGLATPVGGAFALVGGGFMALFELSQSGAGYWPYEMSKDVQTWGILGLLGLVLIFTGPGRYSADVSRGWATRPRASAWLWAVIGIAGTAAAWVLLGGGNPF